MSKTPQQVLEGIDEDTLDAVREKIAGQSTFGIITLLGPITMETIREPINTILTSNLDPDNGFNSITMIICSQGGELPAVMALTDVMIGSSVPIHTVGLGLIASGGLLVLMAGEKGSRLITPNTVIMSHQWVGGSFGKKHELLAERKEQDILTNMLVNFYMKHSSIKSRKKIESVLLPASDVWLTPEEALSYGLCDQIKKFNKKTLLNIVQKSL